MTDIKICVVGDGPIGNIIIAKLLIEHWNNKDNNNKTLNIIHHRSHRGMVHGYSRRHILFITEELIEELEKNVLECTNCLRNGSNTQKLTEDNVNGEKLLFSTRILEEILLNFINKNDKCNQASRCNFTFNVINTKDPLMDYNALDCNYVFFAIGSNAGNVRGPYFYNIKDENKFSSNIKIIAEETKPIVAFYTKLGNLKNRDPRTIHEEDKNSIIYMINEDTLKGFDINLYDLEVFMNILYAFNDNFNEFVKYITDIKLLQNDLEKYCSQYTYIIKKDNLSLNGYDNYADYIKKISTTISCIQCLFKEPSIYDAYITYIKNKNMRTHPINDKFINMYINIINGHIIINNLNENYNKFILNQLEKSITLKKEDDVICTSDGLYSNGCLQQTFLVNIVAQSLNNYGIYDDKLVYAINTESNKKYFLIGDMANAYSPGISVEIGINFVNYIIPMFYNFYINENKTILSCRELNIIEILEDLLSDKYITLLNKSIDQTEYKPTNTTSPSTLRDLIQNIKNNYIRNLTLCDENDIFLTYYNIVSLVQYIKNVDLIIKNKKVIGISKIFKPRNYKILKYSNDLEKF